MDINKLKDRMNKVIKEYIDLFCEKHELVFYYWIGDEIGNTAYFDDFYFDFVDIKYDIENEIPKETIFLWYYDSIETHPDNEEYPSYCKKIMEAQKKNKLNGINSSGQSNAIMKT